MSVSGRFPSVQQSYSESHPLQHHIDVFTICTLDHRMGAARMRTA